MAWIVKDLNGNEIPAMNFIIFQKCVEEENTCYYDYQAAFTKMGQYSQDHKGHHFSFKGDLLYLGQTQFHMTSTITIQDRGNNRVFLKAKRVVPNTDGSFDTDDEYILETRKCL